MILTEQGSCGIAERVVVASDPWQIRGDGLVAHRFWFGGSAAGAVAFALRESGFGTQGRRLGIAPMPRCAMGRAPLPWNSCQTGLFLHAGRCLAAGFLAQ